MTRLQECAKKIELIREMLRQEGLSGVVIKKQANFSWVTAGGRGFVGLASEGACAAVVVTLDCVYLAANNIEGPRLLAEELPEGFAEGIFLPWADDGSMDGLLRKKFGELSDDGKLDAWFRKTRVTLTENEIVRFAETGAASAKILEDVCREIRPGQTEFDAAGEISRGLWGAGIEPITMLVASGERSERVRHYVPTGEKLGSGAICSICSRSGGLVISATRGVAFTKGFAARYENLLKVEEAGFRAIVPGAKLGGVISAMIDAYKANGLPEEWLNHHQGGLTGYLAREIRAGEDSGWEIAENQAFALNPSAVGVKCEDTVLLEKGGLRVLTPVSAGWPSEKVGNWTRPLVLRQF